MSTIIVEPVGAVLTEALTASNVPP
jgi:hypothetical protein